MMNEHDDLIARLRALGSQPVSSDASRRHLASIEAESDGVTRRSRMSRLRIVAAFVVGLLAGTSGLATAGALPNGAQDVAHRAFGAVGVKVPGGERHWGQECAGPKKKNHGQYVRSQPKDKRAEAAASDCGKPVKAVGGGEGPETGKSGGCQGPPPWAGKGKPDKAAKEARKQACGQGHEAEDEKEEAPGPSSMTPDTTTTTAATPTTATTATTTTITTETTATTDTTATTVPPVGGDGETVPSLPADPPAPGQGS